MDFLKAKTNHADEQQWYYLTNSCRDKEIHTFPKGISPKVNVIARVQTPLQQCRNQAC